MPRALVENKGLSTASPYCLTASNAASVSSVIVVSGIGILPLRSVIVQLNRLTNRNIFSAPLKTLTPCDSATRNSSNRAKVLGLYSDDIFLTIIASNSQRL